MCSLLGLAAIEGRQQCFGQGWLAGVMSDGWQRQNAAAFSVVIAALEAQLTEQDRIKALFMDLGARTIRSWVRRFFSRSLCASFLVDQVQSGTGLLFQSGILKWQRHPVIRILIGSHWRLSNTTGRCPAVGYCWHSPRISDATLGIPRPKFS